MDARSSHGLTHRLSPLPLRLARAFVIAALAAAFVAAVGWIVADSWYHDDACTIAEWKCTAGTVGLSIVVGAGIAVATFLLLAVVMVALHVLRR